MSIGIWAFGAVLGDNTTGPIHAVGVVLAVFGVSLTLTAWGLRGKVWTASGRQTPLTTDRQSVDSQGLR